MRLSDASVAIRPRSTWEAMDLGVLMAQQQRRLLMSSWALVSLPVFLLLSLVFWESPSTAMLLFWWLKPAFERLPLYILSTSLFGETPTLGQALRKFPRLLKPQLLASLTWRRFSLSRSFTLPVQQLEGLSGNARQQRLAVLRRGNIQAPRWLTLIGLHLEGVFWIGLIGLLYLFLPSQIEQDWSWQKLLAGSDQQWRWLEHLSNSLYALVLVIWEPIYVACGFSLYLNRRTALEAWDIELVFRRLRQRLSGVAAALLIATSLCLLTPPPAAWAAEPEGPDSPRLLQQPLNSQAARQAIENILAAPPFKNPQTVTRWRLIETAKPAEKPQDSPPPEWLKRWLEGFDGQWLATLAKAIEVLLWGSLIAALALVVYRYREWLQAFVSRRPKPRLNTRRETPPQLFGLAVGAETLPDDIASTAERLWASQPREALGLLYRGLLSHLLHDWHLPLKDADTEGQVLQRVAVLQQPALKEYSQALTQHWQNLAYGHRLPSAHVQQQLCAGWRQLFDREPRP